MTPFFFTESNLTCTSDHDIIRIQSIHLPTFLKPYIEKVGVVASDGNCGFRSVAVSLGLSEEKWPTIRKELKNGLENNKGVFCKILGEKLYIEVLKSVDWEKGPAPKEKWMQMPDLGYVIAVVYRRPFHFFQPYKILHFYR